MKRLFLSAIIVPLTIISIHGQTAFDALRYSSIHNGGSARFTAMGGAFGALGADFSVTGVNPAGIGLYKSSEFTITPGIFNQVVESSYNGVFSDDRKSNFFLGNVGLVITSPVLKNSRETGWKHVHFATGLLRLNDFNSRLYMTGPNPDNSLLDVYLDNVQGPPMIPFEDLENGGSYAFDESLAWWTYMLDITGDSANYQYYIPVEHGGTRQTKTIDRKGSMNEYVFSFGANYNDRLYLGVTLGIPYIRYTERSTYSETDVADTIFDFRNFEKEDYLETKGTGINLKLGVVYRAADWIRLGAAVHTPTWFHSMRDYWWSSMSSQFDNGDSFSRVSPDGNFNYELTTPMRAIGSVAFIFGQYGLVSADYEYRNYGAARLRSFDYNFITENDEIRNAYSGVNHVRLGTEWRYSKLSFRGGFSYAGSPYKNEINDGSETSFSGGIGLREESFFIDLSYVHSRLERDYYLYYSDLVEPNPVSNVYKANNFMLTLGLRF